MKNYDIYRIFLILLLLSGGMSAIRAQSIEITDVTGLNSMTATGNYVIKADINAAAYQAGISNFSGTLEAAAKDDGTYYTVSGLTRPLFNSVNGGTVRNIMLSSVNISTNGHAGAIANEASGASRIYNCGVLSGSVTGNNYVGSLVGRLLGTSRVVNCFSFADVTGGSEAGGIVGYNNYASKASDIQTMVMNCMFYGDIKGGTNRAPVFGGRNINNVNSGGLTTFNYYRYESPFSQNGQITKYNCSLAVVEKYLVRFEFYRQLLNSNRRLAAYYATGSTANASLMAKWVLDKVVAPYPVLKVQGRYPSIINYDAEHATTQAERNKGGLLGTLKVSIKQGTGYPSGAAIKSGKNVITLNRTDKDYAGFNFNYDKVQLPYYNDVGTMNYTGNKVVTGWKITAIEGGSAGKYDTGDKWGGYNFADRNCTQKDLFSVSGRVFAQGAYYDVPYGVTEITIEPYWGKAAYLGGEFLDYVYNSSYTAQGVSQLGTQYSNNTNVTIKGSTQKVYTTISSALSQLSGSTVYDNAVVLIGNFHSTAVPSSGDKPFTMMSIDLDEDNEPDCSYIYSHGARSAVAPIRFDFLNIPGTAMAQKPSGASNIRNAAIFKTKGWFEITNTALMYFSQFEYENTSGITKVASPLILQGGVIDQFVSTQNSSVTGKTIYIHVGGNVWFKAFGLGVHADGTIATPHVPVSVTGGDYDTFYLTGTYQPKAGARTDNAECYISSGRFGEAAGAGQEKINGSVRWQIYDADITDFYGGGVNGANPIQGNIEVDITNSHVTKYCGGPKFGDMVKGKTVTTRATGCVFDNFFGAGNGGNSFLRLKYFDQEMGKYKEFSEYQTYYTNDRGKYFDGSTTDAPQQAAYGKKGPGVAADFDYEFFVWTSGLPGKRFYVKFVTFSLATCNDVSSTLKGCTIRGDFYGGGNLGVVKGTATSVLDDCNVSGSVFGAGYSASIPTIPMRDAGFSKYPNINTNTGLFEPGEFSATTEFEWKHVDALPANGAKGIESLSGKNYVYTDADLTTLGQVAHTSLTIKGSTYVQGLVDGQPGGGIFGGGDESAVTGNTSVTIENTATAGVNDVYGGGNLADVKGNSLVTLTGGKVVGSVYGGAKHADIHKNTEVAVRGGHYNRIFGGNNLGGAIRGTVSVNSQETATQPIVIGQLYGGGNEAAYTAPEGQPGPTLQIKSFTSIGEIYGGGYGASAVVTGDTFIKIDEEQGSSASTALAGETLLLQTGETVTIPAHAAGAIGAIGRVFGGGNAANVVGNTNVQIGTVNSTANIVGNVYGGGNNAEVTGSTNVIVGITP